VSSQCDQIEALFLSQLIASLRNNGGQTSRPSGDTVVDGSMSSIKRDVKKKDPPLPESRRLFLQIQPTDCESVPGVSFGGVGLR
jgi:hypothetical protein